ncbi:hypothetical protein PAHAL_9G577100 [Panicum hallii]|uniref:VPS37 C-terminal domain-containing protein n=1 Tax=Panicum hallii TaxID=206008 RepID=A0A2T8I642_9POAL|nr:hypothetical protein PAHAL_9G577100 [Panicum hallii]
MVAAGRRRRAVMAGVVTPRQRAESKQLPLVPLLPFFPVGRGAAPAAATSWGADGIPALASPLATRSRTPAANPPTPSLRSCRSHRLRPAGRELLQAAPPRLRRGLALPVFLIVPEAHDELTKETLQLARKNLEKEQRILELRNQVQHCHLHLMKKDRLTDLERQKDDIMRFYSPAALLDKLQSSINGKAGRGRGVEGAAPEYKKLRTGTASRRCSISPARHPSHRRRYPWAFVLDRRSMSTLLYTCSLILVLPSAWPCF